MQRLLVNIGQRRLTCISKRPSVFPKTTRNMPVRSFLEWEIQHAHHCIGFLQCALRYMLDVGAELGMIKDVTKKMKDSMPKMLKIWQNSTRGGKGRDEELKAYIQRASALTAEE